MNEGNVASVIITLVLMSSLFAFFTGYLLVMGRKIYQSLKQFPHIER